MILQIAVLVELDDLSHEELDAMIEDIDNIRECVKKQIVKKIRDEGNLEQMAKWYRRANKPVFSKRIPENS